MSSCRQLIKHFCSKCDEIMTFDEVGCVHCRLPRPIVLTRIDPEVHVLRYGGRVAARERQRLATAAAMNLARSKAAVRTA